MSSSAQTHREPCQNAPRPRHGRPRVALIMEALAWGAQIEFRPGWKLELAWDHYGDPVIAQPLKVYLNGRTEGEPDEIRHCAVDLTVAELMSYAEKMSDEQVIGLVFFLSKIKESRRHECQLATTLPSRPDAEPSPEPISGCNAAQVPA